MSPPKNQAYKIDPVTHTPQEMQYDLSVLPPNLKCPIDGGKLQRIGSNPPENIRCVQCGQQFALSSLV
jgi:hypothetical protein